MSDYFLSIGLGGMSDDSGRIVATEPRFVQRHSADLWVSEDFQNHAGMNHAWMNHAGMNHAGMNHAGMNHAGMNHASLIPREPDQSDYSDASADRHASQAVF